MSAARTLDALRMCLSRHDLLRPEAVLVAAVSGGSDSMALLNGLSLLRQETGFTLRACHVQHGLRGEDSLEDERLVREFCRTNRIPLTVHTAQLGGDLHLPGMETRARDCRRTFFAETMADCHGDALLLAHHQDDQTETLLMHLLRGSGGNGLAGMQEAAPFADGLLLRPFLNLSKAALLSALQDWRVPYREDASNQEALTPRNALRLEVLPKLEQLFPGCTARMAQTARLLRRDEAALEGQAYALRNAATLTTGYGLYALLLPALQDTPEAIAIRTLRQWVTHGMQRAGITRTEQSLSAEESEDLLAFALSKDPSCRALNLPGDLQACRGSRWLHLIRQDGTPLIASAPPETLTLKRVKAQLERGKRYLALPGWEAIDLSLRCTLLTPTAPPDTAKTACVPLHMLADCVLRSPLPGDTIHPLGAPGEKPLRRYLTDRKIDPPFRPHLPVLARGDAILWIPGLCTAQALAFQPDTPCLCLTLTQTPPYLNTRKGDERHG